MKCRHCSSELTHTFLDLGFAPPSNAYLSKDDLSKSENYYPLKVKVCDKCWLLQTEDYAPAEEFFNADYAYFSSTSKSWLAHAKQFSEQIIQQLGLNKSSHVIEIASNDGYLLKNFVAEDIPCLGIEPTASTAAAAEKLGIPILRKFFGEALGKLLAAEGKQADLIVCNNVYAHVPDINDFTLGLKAALKAGGTITLEFPYLGRLLEFTQFDTIYHEHFSYLTLYTVSRIFEHAGLRVWKVEELTTHGGSLRVHGCHAEEARITHQTVEELLEKEVFRGMRTLHTYQNFQMRANAVKDELLSFLIQQKKAGKTVVGYGAAAKGNTLLNFAGIKPDLLPFVCDAAISKQGMYLPGSHIPILEPAALDQNPPDYLLILPWNIADEVMAQLDKLRTGGTQFVTAIPCLQIL